MTSIGVQLTDLDTLQITAIYCNLCHNSVHIQQKHIVAIDFLTEINDMKRIDRTISVLIFNFFCFKAPHLLAPAYLSDMLVTYESVRKLELLIFLNINLKTHLFISLAFDHHLFYFTQFLLLLIYFSNLLRAH